MSKINIRSKQYWKYKIIEYDYTSIHHEKGETKIEVCKQLHKTNNILIFWLLILCFRLKGTKYDVVS